MGQFSKFLTVCLFLSLQSVFAYAVEEDNGNYSAGVGSEYGNSDGNLSALAIKEHNNDFCISGDTKDYWKKVDFSIDSYAVARGQPFSGIDPQNQPSNKTCVRVRSGRHYSYPVMEWVYGLLGAEDVAVFTYNTLFEPYPEEPWFANFAFLGTLTLKNKNDKLFTCRNVIIGQFPDSGHNLWFMNSNFGKSSIEYIPFKPSVRSVTLLCNTKQGNQVSILVTKPEGKLFKHNLFILSSPNWDLN